MKKVILLTIILILSLSTYPQDSLMGYLEIAARNNPTVMQRYAEYEAALQKVPQAGSLPDPEFSLGVFINPMEILAGKQIADLRIMQMFPWFGVLKNGKDEMSLMAKASCETFRDAQLEVFYEVQQTWYEMNKLGQYILLSEKSLELLNTIERLSIVRFKAGTTGEGPSSPGSTPSPLTVQNQDSGSPGMNSMGGNPGIVQPGPSMQGNPMQPSTGSSGLLGVYRIQMEINDLQNSVELLKDQMKSLKATFNLYLNRPPDTEIILPDRLVADSIQPTFPEMADSLVKNNPMIAMLQYEKGSLEARGQMISRMGYPMIGVGVTYSLIGKDVNALTTSDMNGRDMIMPMVTATLPIYRKRYRAMKQEVDYLKSANEQKCQATANSLQTDYYQVLQLFRDARRRMELYDRQYLLASKSLDIMISSFASSGADLTEVLRVRQQTFDYEYKHVEAVADYNTSIARIRRIVAGSED